MAEETVWDWMRGGSEWGNNSTSRAEMFAKAGEFAETGEVILARPRTKIGTGELRVKKDCSWSLDRPVPQGTTVISHEEFLIDDFSDVVGLDPQARLGVTPSLDPTELITAHATDIVRHNGAGPYTIELVYWREGPIEAYRMEFVPHPVPEGKQDPPDIAAILATAAAAPIEPPRRAGKRHTVHFPPIVFKSDAEWYPDIVANLNAEMAKLRAHFETLPHLEDQLLPGEPHPGAYRERTQADITRIETRLAELHRPFSEIDAD